MKPILCAIGLGCSIAIACASSSTVGTSAGEVGAAAPLNSRTLPAGTILHGAFNQEIGTGKSHVGDEFSVTLTEAVVAQNGVTAVPNGAVAYGHVSGLHSGGIGQQSVIRLDFDRLEFQGQRYPFQADISGVDVKNDVNKSGAARGAVAGGAAGAVLGAIVSGGDLSKILTGGLLGAAAGTVISLGTGNVDATIPAGSSVTMRTASTIPLR